MKLEHEAKVGIWDGKCIFPYTHANKPQQFNCKMNVILINFEKNMRMNVSIRPHYGWMVFFIHVMYGWKKLH